MIYTLEDSFKLSGEWWLPSKPEDRKRGILSFEPGKPITLKLNKILGFHDCIPAARVTLDGQSKLDDTDYSIIQGHMDTGEHITLLRCRTVGDFLSLIIVELLLVDNREMKFESIEDVRFQRISARWTHLEEWLQEFPLDQKLLLEDDNSFKGFQTDYVPPKDIIVPIDSLGFEIRFVFVATHKIELFKSFTFSQFARVEIVSNSLQALDWLMKQLRHVQDLLAILTNKPIRQFELNIDESALEKDIQRNIHVYYAVPRNTLQETFYPPDMFVSAKDLSEMLPKIFQAWFEPEKQEYISPLRNLFLDVLYNMHSIPEFEFLALTQALETYHRKKYNGQYLTDKQYEHFRSSVIEFINSHPIDKDLKKALDKKLEYSNQYSLNKRLKLLWKQLRKNDKIHQLIGIVDETYIRRIVDSRNYYTHYDSKDYDKAFRGSELIQANTRLVAFIISLILQEELGVPPSKVADALTRQKHIGRLW